MLRQDQSPINIGASKHVTSKWHLHVRVFSGWVLTACQQTYSPLVYAVSSIVLLWYTPVVVTGVERQAYRQTTQETDRQKERPAGRDSIERGQNGKDNSLSNKYKSLTCNRDALWCDKKDLMVTIEKYIFIIITCVFLLQDNTNPGQVTIDQPCLNDRLKWLFHAVVN